MTAGCVVLAAGAARRMGQLKQLLTYADTTLVEHAIRQAVEALFSPVVVVVGAESERVRSSAGKVASVYVAENRNWEAGMGSSIVCGLRTALDVAPEMAQVAVTLADQPLVTAAHLRALQTAAQGVEVAASSFDGTLGSPAVFARSTFAVLLQLPAEAGAKRLFHDPRWRVTAFPLPEARADIDTPEDFARLQKEGALSGESAPLD